MFDWNEFLILAHRLLQDQNKNEAYYRSAISRAYYALYHRSRDFCRFFNIQLPLSVIINGKPEISNHLVLIHTFKNHSSPCLNAFGRKLNTLRNKRNIADYDENYYSTNNINIESEASLVIQDAKSLKTSMLNYS